MDEQPLASVIIPAFEHERYVAASIESALRQTYPRVEILVRDDASSDATGAIAADYARRYPDKIRFFPGERNLGPSAAWTFLFERVRGQVLIPSSSDDLLSADAIAKRVRHLASTDADVVLGDFDLLLADGELLTGRRKLRIVPWFTRFRSVDFERLYDALLTGNFVPGGASAIRLDRVDPNDIRQDRGLRYLSDWNLWLRLSYRYRIARMMDSTWIYRWHGKNLSDPVMRRGREADILSEAVHILSARLDAARSADERARTRTVLDTRRASLDKLRAQPQDREGSCENDEED